MANDLPEGQFNGLVASDAQDLAQCQSNDLIVSGAENLAECKFDGIVVSSTKLPYPSVLDRAILKGFSIGTAHVVCTEFT